MNPSTLSRSTHPLATSQWHLDPSRSSVEFRVSNLWGLATVRDRFSRYTGTLDMSATPAVALVIDADSLDTGNPKRDGHLRSKDFFAAAEHPRVRFEADAVDVYGDVLAARGRLHAAGRHVGLQVEATVTL